MLHVWYSTFATKSGTILYRCTPRLANCSNIRYICRIICVYTYSTRHMAGHITSHLSSVASILIALVRKLQSHHGGVSRELLYISQKRGGLRTTYTSQARDALDLARLKLPFKIVEFAPSEAPKSLSLCSSFSPIFRLSVSLSGVVRGEERW